MKTSFSYSLPFVNFTIPDTAGLADFAPVSGSWSASSFDHADYRTAIAEACESEVGFPVTVQLFREDGRSLADETTEGQLLISRK